MADNNKISVKSIALDAKGEPINTPVRRFEEEKVKIRDSVTDEVTVKTVLKPIVEALEEIEIKVDRIPRGTYKFFPGSKLTLKVTEGEACPSIIPIGEFSLIVGNTIVLEYCNRHPEDGTGIPKSVATTMGDFASGGITTRVNYYYPSRITTQKDLIDYIVQHPGFHSPLVSKRIDHAPEYQEKLDVEKLRVRAQELSQFKKEQLDALKKQEAEVIEQILALEEKHPGLKDLMKELNQAASDIEESEALEVEEKPKKGK